jgi:hypothetical protein
MIRLGPQEGPQADLLSCPCDEIMYGGARGGGKSYGLLLDWVAHEARYRAKARGILFRRSMPELEDFLAKSREVLPLFGAKYHAQKRTWVMSSGATLKLRYLDRDADADTYQGHEYNWMAFDEAGNWPSPDPLDKLRACLRSADGVPVRMLLTTNPGGPGHNWLKARFVDPVPPRTVQYIQQGGSVWTRVFIPSRVQDNRILMRNDPGYVDRISQSGPAWLVRAWLNGDWDVVAGGMFDDIWRRDVHVLPSVPVAEIPRAWRLDRSFDWGSSKPFSVGWWAESNGEPLVYHGRTYGAVRGDLIRVAEWYGWSGRRNEGLRMLAVDIADGVKQRESEWGITGRVQPGPADSAIYSVENGKSIAGDMKSRGVSWRVADKRPGSRKQGWEAIRGMMTAAASPSPREQPGLFIADRCTQFIATVPVLTRSAKDPDDVDTDAEDHIADETRYRVRRPPKPEATGRVVYE